jgi:hypothetical protein
MTPTVDARHFGARKITAQNQQRDSENVESKIDREKI